MDIKKIIIIVISIGWIITLQYFLLDNWISSVNQEMAQKSQDAYNLGLIDTVSELYKQTENCQSAQIKIGNFTREVVDISCFITPP